MRAPSERDQCQAMLDVLAEGFMHDDVPAYRDACAWLRDFANQRINYLKQITNKNQINTKQITNK